MMDGLMILDATDEHTVLLIVALIEHTQYGCGI